MEALNTFVWWLAVALACSVVLGAVIVGVLFWWFGPFNDEEGEQ